MMLSHLPITSPSSFDSLISLISISKTETKTMQIKLPSQNAWKPPTLQQWLIQPLQSGFQVSKPIDSPNPVVAGQLHSYTFEAAQCQAMVPLFKYTIDFFGERTRNVIDVFTASKARKWQCKMVGYVYSKPVKDSIPVSKTNNVPVSKSKSGTRYEMNKTHNVVFYAPCKGPISSYVPEPNSPPLFLFCE